MLLLIIGWLSGMLFSAHLSPSRVPTTSTMQQPAALPEPPQKLAMGHYLHCGIYPPQEAGCSREDPPALPEANNRGRTPPTNERRSV